MQDKQVYCLFNLTMAISEFVFCFDAQYTKFWSHTRPYDYGIHSKIPPTMGGSKVSTFNLQSTDPATTAMPSITLTPSQSTSQTPRQYYPTSQTGLSNTIITSSEQSSLRISGAFTSSYNSKSSSFFSTLTHTNIDDGELIKPPMPTPSEPEYELPTLREIKALANEAKGTPESKCSLCSEVGTDVMYCRECGNYYCKQCVELAHRHTHHSSEHCTPKRPGEIVGDDDNEPKCSVHPGNFLTLYCKEDEMLCCEQCFESEHAGHTALRLEDAVAIVQETLAQRMEDLEKELSETKTGKKEDEISRKIGKKEKKLRRAIDKREKGLCFEIDEMFGVDQGTSGTTVATSTSPSSMGESGGMPHIHEIDPPVSEIEVKREGKCAKAHGSRYVVSFDGELDQVAREISEFGEVIEKEVKK